MDQEELQRKQDFMQATGESEDTFNWSKDIFSTWMSDVEINYDNFCSNGLVPMRMQDLVRAQELLSRMQNEISTEINRRTDG